MLGGGGAVEITEKKRSAEIANMYKSLNHFSKNWLVSTLCSRFPYEESHSHNVT